MHVKTPHISQIIIAISIGFIGGVGVGSFLQAHVTAVSFFIGIFLVVLLIFFGHHRSVWIVAACGGFFVVGMVVIIDAHVRIAQYEQMKGENFSADIIVRDITHKKWHTQVTGYEQERRLNILWDEKKYPQISVGEILHVTCTLDVPRKDDSFDYRMYLATRRIYLVCNDMSYKSAGYRTDVRTIMHHVRTNLESRIFSSIPAPQSALASGLLLGGDDQLSDEIKEQFSRTGMTHIVAVSGYNVSIIIIVVVGLMVHIGFYRRTAIFISILVIISFVMLIGFPSSAVRAGIMGILVLCAATFGRISHAYGALLFAAAIMIVHNPLLLHNDIGFQLSFLATLGIIAVHPILERMTLRIKNSFGIIDMIVVTISAQIFVLPVIAYHFHTVSVISLIVNIFVLPIIPVTMFLVFMLLCFSSIVPIVANVCGWCAYVILTYELWVIEMFANIPWSSMRIDVFPKMWIAVYYVITGAGCLLLNQWIKKHEE